MKKILIILIGLVTSSGLIQAERYLWLINETGKSVTARPVTPNRKWFSSSYYSEPEIFMKPGALGEWHGRFLDTGNFSLILEKGWEGNKEWTSKALGKGSSDYSSEKIDPSNDNLYDPDGNVIIVLKWFDDPVNPFPYIVVKSSNPPKIYAWNTPALSADDIENTLKQQEKNAANEKNAADKLAAQKKAYQEAQKNKQLEEEQRVRELKQMDNEKVSQQVAAVAKKIDAPTKSDVKTWLNQHMGAFIQARQKQKKLLDDAKKAADNKKKDDEKRNEVWNQAKKSVAEDRARILYESKINNINGRLKAIMNVRQKLMAGAVHSESTEDNKKTYADALNALNLLEIYRNSQITKLKQLARLALANAQLRELLNIPNNTQIGSDDDRRNYKKKFTTDSSLAQEKETLISVTAQFNQAKKNQETFTTQLAKNQQAVAVNALEATAVCVKDLIDKSNEIIDAQVEQICLKEKADEPRLKKEADLREGAAEFGKQYPVLVENDTFVDTDDYVDSPAPWSQVVEERVAGVNNIIENVLNAINEAIQAPEKLDPGWVKRVQENYVQALAELRKLINTLPASNSIQEVIKMVDEFEKKFKQAFAE